MKIVWVVTDGAFVVFVVMIAIMMVVVVIAVMMIVVVVAVMVIAIMTRRRRRGRVVVIGKRGASREKPQTHCDYQERNERDDQPTRFFHKAL